jgi:hypothetical protein
MSAELTPTGPHRLEPPWRALRDIAVVVAAAALVGAVCGALWELWWTPPTGLVLDHVWYPDLEGVRQLFTGTGIYVVVALAGGVLLGAVCAWFFDRAELVTLAAVAAGSVLAAWLMFEVGTAMAPPDPTAAASTSDDYTALPGTLEVEGDGAFVAFPAGALTGIAVVFIGLTPTRRLQG